MMTGLLLAIVLSAQGPILTVDGDHFLLDGESTFLLGCSYYGALGIEDPAFLEADLDDLRAHGFNWIRVWATWSAFDNDVNAVAHDGTIRPVYMERLKKLCQMAGDRGIVVDVTVSRGKAPNFPSSIEEHLSVMKALAQELKAYRNVYFDVGNERNIGDARHVPMEEVTQLIQAIQAIDPDRLCTASDGGDIPRDEVVRYLEQKAVDFLCPHRPRGGDSPGQTADMTRTYLAIMKETGRVIPVHYQEPFRRGYGDYAPSTQDFLTDLEQARTGGAAGWCFHNGSVRGDRSIPEERPRRSFDMRPAEGRLFDQLDEVERAFMSALAEAASE